MKKPEFIYIATDKEAERAAAHLSNYNRLGYDVEGTGKNPVSRKIRLLLMQLSTPDVCYVFDARKIRTEILKPVLESRQILKILHNAKYDYQLTKLDTGIEVDNIFDTMLAYRLLTSGLHEDGHGGFIPAGFRDKTRREFPYKSLDFLCRKYLGISLDKKIRSTFQDFQYDKEFSAQQLEYAAEDVKVLHPLCDILGQEIAEQDLTETALLEFDFIGPVADMELTGVCLDTVQWRNIIEVAQRRADELMAEINIMIEPLSEQNTLFGVGTINISSPDQLIEVFAKLGYTLENTESKVLEKCSHPLAACILKHRAYMKLISTYGESLLAKINKHTKRLHFNLHQLGADTGRLSSEDPNIQNIPNDKDEVESDVKISFKHCFVAEERKSMLTADYSQCELRILAEVSQDRKFLEIFRNDQDLHIITSQQVFGYSDKDLETYFKVKKKDKPGTNLLDFFSPQEIAAYHSVTDFRNKTKTINFGIVYGLSAWSLAERFKMPQEEAEGILNSYFRTYSGIKRWLDKNSHETIANRYAVTLLGRKKFFTLADPADEELFRRSKGAVRRMGNNMVIQGTNADITKDALVRISREYKKTPGAAVLFTVHDEIVSEVPAEKAEKIAALKAELMKQAFHRFIKTVPVGPGDKVSVTIAPHWNK